MRRGLLIAAGFGEWRAAWLEDGMAVELHVERCDRRAAGSIVLGRVVRRIAGLDAALVDIGEERPGFLPLRRGGEGDGVHLDEGARVIVQVRREARRGKGALLSRRTASGDAERITERAARLEPPVPLDPAPGFAAALALRLPGLPDRVLVDDAAALHDLRQTYPQAEIAHRPGDEWPLDLDAMFEAALAPSVALPGGGAIHIEESRAAVLIDVDTGSPETGSAARTALAANLAAAREIARQLRLRQLGGGVVVDFAALDRSGPRERVRQAVSAALAGDPVQPQVLGWTRLGHLELVRPRRSRSLGEAMLEPRGLRASPATQAFAALRALYREARARPAANWRLVAAPAVESALRGPVAAGLRALEARLGRAIAITGAHGDTTGDSDRGAVRRDADPFDIVAL